MDDEFEDSKFIQEKDHRPKHIYAGESLLGSGKRQTFSCPSCGSWNTEESVYYERCKTCGWEQGY